MKPCVGGDARQAIAFPRVPPSRCDTSGYCCFLRALLAKQFIRHGNDISIAGFCLGVLLTTFSWRHDIGRACLGADGPRAVVELILSQKATDISVYINISISIGISISISIHNV